MEARPRAQVTRYRTSDNADLKSYDLEEALSAGESLNREPIERFEEAFGVVPRDGYGQTETVALVTNYPGIDVVPDSMGRPTPGAGTTVIELGEETFSGEHYRTGDLARRDEAGRFYFEGRADDIIISDGYRKGPFEVEDALVTQDTVAEAAAVGSPHEERGQVVKAYVILAEVYDPGDDLKAETAPYKYPRRIEFVDELPKTCSGKIRRTGLRDEEAEKQGT